jgi:4-hydroxy-tetrahydrodipicolinate reductase
MAVVRGHQVVITVDMNNTGELDGDKIKEVDVALEFSTPDTAYENIIKCFHSGISVVSGTTGWTSRLDEVRALYSNSESAFLYASNFSLGVNILFHLNKQLARIMDGFPQYEVTIEETHHTQKLDAPSGTAITLAGQIVGSLERKAGWTGSHSEDPTMIPVLSNRTGSVPGDHTVQYESSFDLLQLKHSAKSRKGFAMGAILAAEFIKGKAGSYTMQDVLRFS